MATSGGARPQAALAKASHLRWPLARRPAVPALAAAPPGTLWTPALAGDLAASLPTGPDFYSFSFFLKVDRRLVQLTGFPPVGS